MKMNQKLMLASAALAAVLTGVRAQAQNGLATPYANFDLLLDFRVNNAGTAGPNDYTLDLGNVNTFVTAHAGQRFQITDFSVVNSALGNLNNVYWSAAATDGASTANVWLTSQRGSSTDASVSDSYQLDRKSSLSQGTARNGINGVGSNTGLGTTVSPTVISTPDSAAYSYQHFVTSAGTFGYTGAGSASTTGNGYEGVTGAGFSGANSLDFYSLPSGTGKGSYLGFFELDSNGSLFWVDQAFVSAVPEPAAYGLMAGLGLLVVAIRKQVKAAV